MCVCVCVYVCVCGGGGGGGDAFRNNVDRFRYVNTLILGTMYNTARAYYYFLVGLFHKSN